MNDDQGITITKLKFTEFTIVVKTRSTTYTVILILASGWSLPKYDPLLLWHVPELSVELLKEAPHLLVLVEVSLNFVHERKFRLLEAEVRVVIHELTLGLQKQVPLHTFFLDHPGRKYIETVMVILGEMKRNVVIPMNAQGRMKSAQKCFPNLVIRSLFF